MHTRCRAGTLEQDLAMNKAVLALCEVHGAELIASGGWVAGEWRDMEFKVAPERELAFSRALTELLGFVMDAAAH